MRRAAFAQLMAASALMAGACVSKVQITGEPVQAPSSQMLSVIPTHDRLDLLFVVDNAGSAAEQAKLAEQVPILAGVLEGLPAGRPDLHVAVITTDMGAASNAP